MKTGQTKFRPYEDTVIESAGAAEGRQKKGVVWHRQKMKEI